MRAGASFEYCFQKLVVNKKVIWWKKALSLLLCQHNEKNSEIFAVSIKKLGKIFLKEKICKKKS